MAAAPSTPFRQRERDGRGRIGGRSACRCLASSVGGWPKLRAPISARVAAVSPGCPVRLCGVVKAPRSDRRASSRPVPGLPRPTLRRFRALQRARAGTESRAGGFPSAPRR
ncbi:hypothetical protein EBL87_02880 [Cereibacter sphaeroides]|nr:hypothetical protein EBL87_02880 [Cereibacter sphaeroides]AZB69323.1 hypothetical protein EBL86_13540 [Cereibacter sphaeroides]